jgi:hypothetical protein
MLKRGAQRIRDRKIRSSLNHESILRWVEGLSRIKIEIFTSKKPARIIKNWIPSPTRTFMIGLV